MVERNPRKLGYLLLIIATTIAHIAALAAPFRTTIASNVIQFFCALLAITLSLRRAYQTSDKYFRHSWLQLGAAFTIWAGAQGCYLTSLLRHGVSPRFPSAADFLWLLFSFPILLVTVRRRTGVRWDWVTWLDAAQACTFFTLLYLLVFSHPATLTVVRAYDVQSVALLLACALRYCGTFPGKERFFFRNLGLYLLVYGVLSSVGNRVADGHHVWADLCWSAPLLLFCYMVVLTPHTGMQINSPERNFKLGMPSHFQGMSALGLALLSLTAALLLMVQREDAGLIALAVSLLLLAIRTSARESQLTSASAAMQHAAFHDTLTGLANRAYLLKDLAHRLQQPVVLGQSIGLLFLDLDRFKNINDSLGHPFGDRLLIKVASILCSTVGPEDLVVRLGGDEFVVLMHPAEQDSPEQLAAALVRRLRQPIELEGRVLYLTASIGITTGMPGDKADDLLRNADCAMYEAKRLGKNQAQSFCQEMTYRANRELELEQDLRQAIGAGELLCYYQPIYSLSQETIAGFEVLSRWNHPLRGLVSPGGFIPLAEETGLIIELGKQVLREACYQVQQWNSAYGLRNFLSVNVTGRQFADPELLSWIKHVLELSGLDPTLLKLEVTESALLSDLTCVVAILDEVRALGIQVSLDDFGTGYSSLSYLLDLPFDVIKVDQSFVRALDKNPRRAELVRTILELAKTLDKNVVVEGVETKEERDWLANMNCNLLQGFYFSKPLPSNDIEFLLTVKMQSESTLEVAAAHS